MASSQGNDPDRAKQITPLQNETDSPDSGEGDRLMADEGFTIDLPDVADIPGQENIIPPKMGMFADTTIASDGEEGTEVFNDDDDEEL